MYTVYMVNATALYFECPLKIILFLYKQGIFKIAEYRKEFKCQPWMSMMEDRWSFHNLSN